MKKYLIFFIISIFSTSIYSQSTIEEIKELSNTQIIKEGNELVRIKLPSIDGDSINLNELKGKYLFINIWATWCEPCIKKIPYFKRLTNKYQDNNIEFVMISVDNSKEKWQNSILNNSLQGIQLFADGQNTKPICHFIYRVYEENGKISGIERGIPQYVLVDPSGIIIHNSLNKLTDESMELYLDELLIKKN